jgi:UDP-N-acetylmuramyl pentapeptide synthase
MAVFVGKEFEFVNPSKGILHFTDTAKAKEYFAANPIAEAIILLKGSNSMHMGDMEAVL